MPPPLIVLQHRGCVVVGMVRQASRQDSASDAADSSGCATPRTDLCPAHSVLHGVFMLPRRRRRAKQWNPRRGQHVGGAIQRRQAGKACRACRPRIRKHKIKGHCCFLLSPRGGAACLKLSSATPTRQTTVGARPVSRVSLNVQQGRPVCVGFQFVAFLVWTRDFGSSCADSCGHFFTTFFSSQLSEQASPPLT